jgi:small Trp-rich protein
MAFVIVGVVLIVMKLAAFGPVAVWSWWWVLAPFALAAVWWAWADSSGYTQRRAMDKDQARKEERRRRNVVNLGLDDKGRRPK